MFTKRKPIVIGETYIFDVLGESDMSPTTSLVTIIKKAKRKTYTVMSCNTKEVFECPQELLTPYSEEVKIVRCQFGTTDFDEADLEYLNSVNGMYDLVDGISSTMQEVSDDPETVEQQKQFDEATEHMRAFNKILIDKIKRYYDITQYKYMLKEHVLKSKQISKDDKRRPTPKPIISKSKLKKVSSTAEPVNVKSNEEFIERFDANLTCYARGTITFDEWLKTAIDIIVEVFPIDNAIEACGVPDHIRTEDIAFIIGKAIETVETGRVVFLVAKNQEGRTIVFSISEDDIHSTDIVADYMSFVSTLYPDWPKNSKTYKCNRRMITLAVNMNDIEPTD